VPTRVKLTFAGVAFAILIAGLAAVFVAQGPYVIVGLRPYNCTFGGGSMSLDTMHDVGLDPSVRVVGLHDSLILAAAVSVERRGNIEQSDWYLAGHLKRRADGKDLGIGVWRNGQSVGALNPVARKWSEVDADRVFNQFLSKAAEKCAATDKGR
jgi:hypothetical protein